jgi:hypothetical protein
MEFGGLHGDASSAGGRIIIVRRIACEADGSGHAGRTLRGVATAT